MTTPCCYCEAPLCKVCIHGDLDIDEVPKLRAENERLKAELAEAKLMFESHTEELKAADKELAALRQSQQAGEPKCSPTLTECPRCKNNVEKCDGLFAPQPSQPESLFNWQNGNPTSLKQPSQPSEDARDAARYRWLRDMAIGFGQVGSFSPYVVKGQLMTTLEGGELDAAIDAAMQKGIQNESKT